MNTSMTLQNQLLATKFFLPIASGPLISRPRLTALLAESLNQPLTLVSAPAGFGKTTLLADWGKSLPTNNPRLCWVSLDEEDNEPRLFWTYILTALNMQLPDRFTPLLTQLQSPQPPPFRHVLMALINLFVESTEHFVLILDDYHLISEPEVHTTLSYLVEHLPPQLRIILATRTDPPLHLSRLQTRRLILEVRTDELRCTVEETRAFFHEVMGVYLPDETIQQVTTRTEGWLVGLQLLGLSLSRGDLNAACCALHNIERIGTIMSPHSYLHACSYFTTIDQVRLWLACGDLDRAIRWVEPLQIAGRHGTPFAREREEVARARIFLATDRFDLALQRLEPVQHRATAGQRWGHVIEIRLLQALAHQVNHEETKALEVLSEAVRLAEPEGYIRSFVDEGAPMATLLYRLRKRDRKSGPTPYLDTMLAAFQQEMMKPIQAGEQTKAQALPDPLSERELQVLQLIVQGASNQEIAQELVITYDTVKRHVSHIFSKLGVNNHVQAVKQARNLSLLGEQF